MSYWWRSGVYANYNPRSVVKQVFVPYREPIKVAECLSGDKRLRKQIIECQQILDALSEFGCDGSYLEKGAEACDVTIRCYLLGQAINEVLDEICEEQEE